MSSDTNYQPIDYLVIGHLLQDIYPAGQVLGGTAAYASLTAASMGLRVGVLTAYPHQKNLPEMKNIQLAAQPVSRPTTFENQVTPRGRRQIIHHVAEPLHPESLPAAWVSTPIVHFGPMAQELPHSMVSLFPDSFIGLTPQGWLRNWDEDGVVSTGHVSNALEEALSIATAVVISVEDVAGDEQIIQRFASLARLLIVTEAAYGARIYHQGQVQHIQPPVVSEVDPTGAGDIFSAVFFIHLHRTGNVEEAAKFATRLAAQSVSRPGLNGIPQPAEVQQHLAQTLENI